MYAATQEGGQGAPTEGAADANNTGGSNDAEDVTDVEFEEVEEK